MGRTSRGLGKYLEVLRNGLQPLLVFKKAFQEYNIEEFDYFMSGMIYFSLGAYDHVPERNMVSPYIHLTKMLDAGHLILERRGK